MSDFERYEFEEDFQAKIVAMMITDPKFIYGHGELIKPEYFGHPEYQNIAFLCLKHVEEYGCAIDHVSLKQRLPELVKTHVIEEADLEEYVEIVDDLVDFDIIDTPFVTEQVLQFAKKRALRNAVLRSAKYVSDDEYDKVLPEIIEAATVGSRHQKEIDFFPEYKDRVYHWEQYHGSPIGTMIQPLDSVLKGGLHTSEVGVFVGPASSGKSMAMIHLGKSAVFSGLNVIHITNEMPPQKIADRYASSITGIAYDKLYQERSDVGAALAMVDRQGFMGKLWIKGFPSFGPTMLDYRAFVHSIINRGHKVDLVIVDYLNEVGRHTSKNAEHAELADIFGAFRGGIVQEFNVAGWTCTHVTRESEKREVKDLTSIGGTKRIGDMADVVITLNYDEDEHARNMLRLFVAKNRDGRRGMEIPIKHDFAKILFYKGRED